MVLRARVVVQLLRRRKVALLRRLFHHPEVNQFASLFTGINLLFKSLNLLSCGGVNRILTLNSHRKHTHSEPRPNPAGTRCCCPRKIGCRGTSSNLGGGASTSPGRGVSFWIWISRLSRSSGGSTPLEPPSKPDRNGGRPGALGLSDGFSVRLLGLQYISNG